MSASLDISSSELLNFDRMTPLQTELITSHEASYDFAEECKPTGPNVELSQGVFLWRIVPRDSADPLIGSSEGPTSKDTVIWKNSSTEAMFFVADKSYALASVEPGFV
jgi:hypothetical protein